MLAFISEMTFFRMVNAKAPANIKVQLLDTVHGQSGLMRNVVYEEALL